MRLIVKPERALLLAAAVAIGAAFSTGAFAQTKPKVALYIANDSLSTDEKSYITSKFLSPFTASGLYSVIDRSDIFTQKATKERIKQRDGSVNEKEIYKIGYEAGAKYVCMVDLRRAFGKYNISARLVDVETAEIYLTQGETDIIGSVADADFGWAAKVVFNQIHGDDSAVNYIIATPPQSDPAEADGNYDAFQQYKNAAAANSNTQPSYSAQYYAPGDFTPHQRWRTFWNNFFVPGLGSAIVMKDKTGMWVQIGGAILGYSLTFSGVETYYDYWSEEEYTVYNESYYVGLCVLFGNFVFNIVRSAAYKGPESRTAAKDFKPYDGLKMAIIPAHNGEFKAVARYDYSF